MKRNIFSAVFMIVTAVCLSNCVSTSTSSTTTTAVTNLETISNDLAPDSLDYSRNNASISAAKAEGQGDPCAAVGNDLFACQPVLLQLYLETAESVVNNMAGIVSEVGEQMGSVPDGGTGTVSWGTTTVEYSKTTATDYSILIKEGSTPIGYMGVNGSVYTIQMDFDSMPAGETGGVGGRMQAVATYTDENTWDIVFLMIGMACREDDVRAPERISIQVGKAGGLWTGKAMFYNGRWLTEEDPTCSTEVSDSLSMNFYTDFVANDTAAKASVYMMQRTKSSLDDIADFGLDSLVTNFPEAAAMGDTSAYVNPFCNPAGTLDVDWDNNCSTRDAAVSAASYSDPTNWVVPSEFWQREITIPDSL